MQAIFLDRDGVLNELVYYPDYQEDESPRQPADLRLLPGVCEAMYALQYEGWALFLLSNQPSYAKGKTTLKNLKAVHQALLNATTEAGINFTACYYSYTHPRGIVPEYTSESLYRKPNPGYLLEAQRDYGVNFATSWFVGDRDTDIQCGQQVGMNTALITYPLSQEKQGQTNPTWTCKDLPHFAQKLKETP